MSKSATKARIAPERRKRIVDIPRFPPRPIPARGAFVADLDTTPPRVAPGAPPVPLGRPRITFQLLSALSRTSFSRAFGEIRAGGGQRGTVRSMLSPRVLAGEENLRLAAELIVPGSLFNGRLRAFPGSNIMRSAPMR